ncbi:DnaJ-domain-containing protein [Marasmius fiardii PR-910]|nr:DnaJ-domain-containing protein [Marasmius fiardii PR-910]
MFRPFPSFSQYPRLGRHCCRYSSNSPSNSLPFPTHANPTPHQIFHLSRSASQEEIKERYYELVRIYHPDKNKSSESSEETAHARFQAISNAYNILRGHSPTSDSDAEGLSRYGSMSQQATTASRRAAHIRRHRELYASGAVDDRWKDRFILFGTVAAVVAFVVQAMITRREALIEAMDRTHLNRVKTSKSQAAEDPRLSASTNEGSKSSGR